MSCVLVLKRVCNIALSFKWGSSELSSPNFVQWHVSVSILNVTGEKHWRVQLKSLPHKRGGWVQNLDHHGQTDSSESCNSGSKSRNNHKKTDGGT